jgi:hypothetical protein
MELEERAASARALLSDPIFRDVLDTMYSRHIGILAGADIGSLTASAAHAMLRAINELRSELESIVTEKKMHDKFHKGKQHDG